jgi:flavin reductase (DIM6/NTAB) family NADH-FMN oxidoreductase RutF
MSWMTTPDPPEMKDRFKHAMRRLASTVTIITTECAGQRYGMVATAVCSTPSVGMMTLSMIEASMSALREKRSAA